MSFLDALFTATSAQCVTGLSVVDTGTRLSLFGQGVLLLLIQVGGLGIMTFSVYLFIYLRVGVSARGRWIINETLMHTPVGSVARPDQGHLRHDAGHRSRQAPPCWPWPSCPRLGFWPGPASAVFHAGLRVLQCRVLALPGQHGSAFAATPWST